jgi:uncharacterized integral membrane protein
MSETQVRVEKQPTRGMGKLIGLGIVAVLFLIFILQNTQEVEFEFLFFDFTWPAWLMLVVLFVLGMLTGFITSALLRRRRRKARRDERRG